MREKIVTQQILKESKDALHTNVQLHVFGSF